MTTPSPLRRAARVLAVGCIAVLTALLGANPAHADDGRADSYVFDGQVTPEGTLRATTTMTFTDAPDEVEQRLALEAPIDEHRRYAYDITDVAVTIGGAEAAFEASEQGDYLVVTIDTSGAGEEPVVLSYEVSGATHTERGSTGELTIFRWRALQGLSVEVAEVSGTIRIPAIPELIDCVAGPPGGVQKCQLYAAGTHDAPMPTFSSSNRGVGEQVTITVGVTSGAVASTADVQENWNLNRAFELTPVTVLVALAALVMGALILWLLHRRTGVDADAGGDFAPVATFRPIGDGESVFEVADSVRPGHVGTVADEHVDPVDVTATLLDLAVRRHIHITELKRDSHGMLDWQIVRHDVGDDDLAPFEARMLDAIAPVGGQSLVSALPETLSPAVPAVQDALYDDVVARGWFDSRPDATRNNWRRLGYIGLAVAAVAAVLLVALTNLGLLALVLVLLAFGLVWVADRMPRRTREGAKLVRGLGALSSLLATHPTETMPSGRELTEISRLLPYAVVLGGKQRWLAAMVDADEDDTADPTDVYWYQAHDEWHLSDLPASLTQFIHTVQGELFSR